MNYSNGLKPFSDYWLNCKLNDLLSILISINPSFHQATYENSYQYIKYKGDYKKEVYFSFVEITYINWFTTIENEVIQDQTAYYFNPDHLLNEVKQILQEKKLFSIMIDLFYLIPGHLFWQNQHCEHYILITGYDEQNKSFLGLCDDMYGYNVHSIPEERFIMAFNNAKVKNPPCFILTINQKLLPYELSLDKIIDNAKRLVKELSTFHIDEEIWYLENNSKFDYNEVFSFFINTCITGTTKIVERQIGNQLLFNHLSTLYLINNNLSLPINKDIDELKKGWQKIKNIFIKHKLQPSKLNLSYLHELGNSLIKKEAGLWQKLTD